MSDSDSEDDIVITSDIPAEPLGQDLIKIIDLPNVDDNEETVSTDESILGNQSTLQNRMQDNVVPEHTIEQSSQECNRPVRNRQPPERLSYYTPGKSLLISNVNNVFKVPYIPVFSNIVSSIRRCIQFYRSQPDPVVYAV